MRIHAPGSAATDQGPFRTSGTYLGEAFSGKTHNICTWHSKDGVVLLVAMDPDTGTARSMPNVVVVEIESWTEFEMDVMPYVRARELEKLLADKAGIKDAKVDTLGIDTISVGATRCFNEILGDREQSDRKDFGLLLNKLTAACMSCVDITRQYQEGQRTYNAIFGSHLVSPVAESARARFTAAIPGQFKDVLPRLGGFAFICKQAVKAGPIVNGVPTKERSFYVHTAPPNDMYTCGDRIGGEGKLYKKLDPTTGGTYHELLAAWGVPPEKW